MNPGELNCLLELFHAVKANDGQGGYAVTYPETPYGTAWGKIKAITARRVNEYEQLTPEIEHQITIRHRGDVVHTDRLTFGARIFEQLSPPVNVGEKNAYLQLRCREVVPDNES